MTLSTNPPLLLDGGTATELERAGMPIAGPWWTSAALLTEDRRRMLRAVHSAYLAAGSAVVTANTFRCNLRAMRAAGLDGAGPAWLVHAALGVALAARNEAGGRATIAASMAPVEDCYRPDLVPPDDELHEEHRWLATELVRGGAELVLIETMNCRREASIALEEALAAGARAWVSFVCAGGTRLLSGEPLAAAARAVEAGGADVVLVNCSELGDTEACLRVLREVRAGPAGAYPNTEGRRGAPVDTDEFADVLARWHHELDITVLGGCCGTTPAHIEALRGRVGAGQPPASGGTIVTVLPSATSTLARR